MDNIVFDKCQISELNAGDWIRTSLGEIGVIHDKVDQVGYRKASVEIPGSRYAIRIIDFDVTVEHVTDQRRSRN